MPDYLVQYGASAFVGRFAATGEHGYGDAVVVQTPRGRELGKVLGGAPISIEAHGEVLHRATAADVPDSELANAILDAAQAVNQSVSFIDCEITLDRATAILHALPWGECQLDESLAELSARFGLNIRLLDLTRMPRLTDPPEPSTTCSKPGCGTDAGGCSSCSTGKCGSGSSCSSGKVKSAAELTSIFTEIRQAIEAPAAMRTPLN